MLKAQLTVDPLAYGRNIEDLGIVPQTDFGNIIESLWLQVLNRNNEMVYLVFIQQLIKLVGVPYGYAFQFPAILLDRKSVV